MSERRPLIKGYVCGGAIVGHGAAALLLDRSDVALIVWPMFVAWRHLREQIGVFDKAIRVLVRSNSACRLLMSIVGIGVFSALAYASAVEDPGSSMSNSSRIGKNAPSLLGPRLCRHNAKSSPPTN
jgi:transposase